MRLKSATIGIEAPEPISSASLPHSWVSARRAAASCGMFQSSAIAGATLAALKARRHPTAILSNGSPAMLASAVAAAGFGPHLDAVLSVDALRMYKPRPEIYRMVTERFGVAPAEVTFVSSNRWDVMGARAFGFRCAWINRAGLPDEYADLAPDRVLTDLGSLLA